MLRFSHSSPRTNFCGIVAKFLMLNSTVLKPFGVKTQQNLAAKRGFQGLGGPSSPGQASMRRKKKPGSFLK